MMNLILSTFVFLTLSSCALFKGQNLQEKKTIELLSFIQGEGEGKGRLGIGQNQYLFSFEALLKENSDWLLAINIPLHGEELLLFPDLRSESPNHAADLGFELKLEKAITEYLVREKRSPEMAKIFIQEIRNMMRFVLHQKIGRTLSCAGQECSMGDIVYQVTASPSKLSVKKLLASDYEIELAATNLTGSIFQRTSLFLQPKKRSSSTPAILSLDLFWN